MHLYQISIERVAHTLQVALLLHHLRLSDPFFDPFLLHPTLLLSGPPLRGHIIALQTKLSACRADRPDLITLLPSQATSEAS